MEFDPANRRHENRSIGLGDRDALTGLDITGAKRPAYDKAPALEAERVFYQEVHPRSLQTGHKGIREGDRPSGRPVAQARPVLELTTTDRPHARGA